eukprot:10521665-Lingulodinium_polyedra.AAC.1
MAFPRRRSKLSCKRTRATQASTSPRATCGTPQCLHWVSVQRKALLQNAKSLPQHPRTALRRKGSSRGPTTRPERSTAKSARTQETLKTWSIPKH